MNLRFAVFAALFVIGNCQGPYGWGGNAPNWVGNLQAQIQQQTANIHANIQRMQAEIQENVRRQVAAAAKMAENLRSLNGTSMINNGGSSLIINQSGGTSRSIVSGLNANGSQYIRDVEEKYDGNMLYHTERITDVATNTVQTIKWKLDLSKPGATPEIITDQKK